MSWLGSVDVTHWPLFWSSRFQQVLKNPLSPAGIELAFFCSQVYPNNPATWTTLLFYCSIKRKFGAVVMQFTFWNVHNFIRFVFPFLVLFIWNLVFFWRFCVFFYLWTVFPFCFRFPLRFCSFSRILLYAISFAKIYCKKNKNFINSRVRVSLRHVSRPRFFRVAGGQATWCHISAKRKQVCDMSQIILNGNFILAKGTSCKSVVKPVWTLFNCTVELLKKLQQATLVLLLQQSWTKAKTECNRSPQVPTKAHHSAVAL